MNKICRFFRKPKKQAGEEIQSQRKDILTPAELEKLKNKIRQEIASAELRVAYIVNRQERPKPSDKKEIEEREADIRNLRTKYQELLDLEVTVYVSNKQQAEPLAAAEPLTATESTATEQNEKNPPINPRQIKENSVSDLFDYRPEKDEVRAAPPHIEELSSECINCTALVTYSVHAQTEQCRKYKAEIQPKDVRGTDRSQIRLRDLLTDKVEKEDVTEERSLLQDFLEDDKEEFLYDEQESEPNEHEEQNNNEHIYDSVDDQSDDENQQERLIFFRHYFTQ